MALLIDPVGDAIVRIIAAHGRIAISPLKDELREAHDIIVSDATLYRYVSELIEAQILVRHRRKLALNLVWISSIRQFAEQLNNTYGSYFGFTRIPVREGQKVEYFGDSLALLDSTWNHIRVELGTKYGQTEWYGYNSHPCYSVGMPETERRLFQSMVAHGFRYHLLFGNSLPLDRWGLELIKVPGYETRISEAAPFPKEGCMLWASANYTIECQFPAELRREFRTFFATTVDPNRLDRSAFQAIFFRKIKCSIVVRRSTKSAVEIWKTLQPFFK